MRIEGKVVLITGASSGIGEASARALARCGARVALAARSVDRLRRLADELTREGHSASPFEMDVTSDASVASAVEDVGRRLGPIDVVVNNAGNGGRLSFFEATAPEHMRAMFDVHVFGTERVTRAVLPAMLERRAGTLVNVVSAVAYVPMPAAAAYCAAKAAVVAFSEALRGEVADRNVSVVLFAPPHTQTEAGRAWPLDLPKQFMPAFVADALVTTLRRDRREALPGGNAALLWLSRLSPRLAARMMRGIGLRAARKALAAPRTNELVG
jgi:short-subunit dehydrogenase